MDQIRKNHKPEFVEGGFVEIEETGEFGSDVIELPDELRKEIHNSLKPQLENMEQHRADTNFCLWNKGLQRRVGFNFSQR